jgi:hypothetical protein
MTLHSFFRTMKSWPVQILAAVVLVLSPIAAGAGTLTATATITPTANSNGTTHYAIALTATGTDNIETMWFGWIPGSFCLTASPTNVTVPSGWTGDITPVGGDFAIEWFTGSNPVKAGQTLTGFSFDSAETPAQIGQQCAQLSSIPALTTFVYENDAAGFEIIPSGDSQEIVVKLTEPLPASPAVAAVLPGGRSVQVGKTATVFATMINGGTTGLTGCSAALPTGAPAGLALAYQATDPMTNAPVGSPNTPVNIAGSGSQTFILSFTSGAALSDPGQVLDFNCSGFQPVVAIPGVNTVDLSFSTTAVADVIALAATATPGLTLQIPQSTNGEGAFAVASVNVGTTESLTVSTDTGSAALPVDVVICQTNPTTGACLAPPASTVMLSDTADAVPTFSVFAVASAPIALNAATSRIFVRFKDSAGTSHGSTSVAVETN